MIQQEDARDFTRFSTKCKMRCQFVDDDRTFDAACSNLSGSGILFQGRQSVALGKALQIHVNSGSGLTPPFVAFVEVVRCTPAQKGNFLIAGSIKGIKSV